MNCPRCGVLILCGGEPSVKCENCGTRVIVPVELRAAAPERSRESQDAAALAEIRRLALRGNKIAAVRLYLDTFGGGLRQAKDAVDAMARP
ncbi:MAG: hypothetical protein ACM3JD_11195 [Rudaea sp.]